MENYKINFEGEMAHVVFTTDTGEYTLIVPNAENLEAVIQADFQNWVNMAIYEQSKNKMTILTKYQFLSRFTISERLAIFALEATEPMVKMWLEMFRICEEIDISDPETIAGINMMETMGVIVPGRAGEILQIS